VSDTERLRDIAFAAKSHWGYDAELVGATRLEWEAEPNAVGFYEKMGGRHIGDRMSSWGRMLSVMGVDLPPG
jgi:hypothetical protein